MEDLNEIPQQKCHDKPLVILTGFGLFRGYELNPSWEAAKRINIEDVNLIIKQVQVDYNEVDQTVDEIWTKYDPLLVIHCGVSHLAKGLVLESCAFGSGYQKIDVNGCFPNCKEMCQDNLNNECVKSKINLGKVCDKINKYFEEKIIDLPSVVSCDAGRYLCEYIYYSSLKRNCKRTVFIHVPEIDNPFSLEQITKGLEFAIKTLIGEVTNQS